MSLEIPKVYLETTMFNFPFADDAPKFQRDTLEFFQEIKEGKFIPYSSIYAMQELKDTTDESKRIKLLQLVDEYKITILPMSDESERVARIYLSENIIPKHHLTDALHIAVAVVNELDFIVSLNFRHIVRKKTIENTEIINYRLGYKRVMIYAPGEVIENEAE
jgi:predicted nucleic acid-binding protein